MGRLSELQDEKNAGSGGRGWPHSIMNVLNSTELYP